MYGVRVCVQDYFEPYSRTAYNSEENTCNFILCGFLDTQTQYLYLQVDWQPNIMSSFSGLTKAVGGTVRNSTCVSR